LESQISNSPTPATRLTRRQLFKRLATFSILPIGAGYYAHDIEPFWPKFPDVPVQIRSLPKSFEGFRLVQITDMHTGRVPYAYLQKSIDRVKKSEPDLAVFTGDLLHHRADMIQPVTNLLKGFDCPVLVSFGNHDFAPYRGDTEPYDPDLDFELQNALVAIGCHVLRNDAMPIEKSGQHLWFVGLDDLWFGDFNPQLAFSKVPPGVPVIALSHNPDTAYMLADNHPDLILSGHTHGGQIRLPFYGPPRMNVNHTELDMGHFQLPHSQLYVAAGLGYIQRIRFNCRPEVPTFVLRA
jgi:predicted MPP superfamily phosphohydrolase